MQFQQDWLKIKNYSSFRFLPEKLEKFCLTGLYDAPIELSISRAALESFPFRTLKYAVSAGLAKR